MAQELENFQILNLEALKLLSLSVWCSFSENEQEYLLKGRATATQDGTCSYALLLTDLKTFYFCSAQTTQIQQEISDYNPNIQGGISGIIKTLNSIISKFDPRASYSILGNTFSVSKVLNNIYKFKWDFNLEALSPEASQAAVKNYLILPFSKTLMAQDRLLKTLEEQLLAQDPRRKPSDIRSYLDSSQSFPDFSGLEKAQEALKESFMVPLRELELKTRKEAKRKAPSPAPQKRAKPNTSETEAKRKKELQSKLNKAKKKTPTMDFL